MPVKQEEIKEGLSVMIPLEDYEDDWYNYPDEMVKTLCDTCHGASEYQSGAEKSPVNGRGEDAKLERLSNPESEQTKLDDFE